MPKEISKTQIDRLGDRLKKGHITEDDLRLLDQYRLSFTEAYEAVVGAIRRELSLEPTSRPAKSTTSISEKLRRESIRLTQIQDIAGCRLVVADIASQDSVVESLCQLFEQVNVIDRRRKPSHGYRAVHVVVGYRGKLIEIQVRTSLQHLWAELSEKFSDVIDPAIKYGGGKDEQEILKSASSAVADVELFENAVEVRELLAEQEMPDLREELNSMRQRLFKLFQSTIDFVERFKGGRDDLSN
jgi:putative GTP pyrophosphokinase